MKHQKKIKIQPSSGKGVVFAAIAYLIWGFSPVYWKELSQVPAFETILHRVVWSFLFFMPIILIQKKWGDFKIALKDYKTLFILFFTAFLVSCNWLVFIWSVNNGHLMQAALGYYINPLVNVMLGMIFLKERLRRLQVVAVCLAAIGVAYLTLSHGELPWISLTLAFSFGFYGLIRKSAQISSVIGLAIETLILTIPASIYLVFLESKGSGAFYNMGLKTSLFLAGTALVTALPLLFFNMAAKRLKLSTMGFLQYFAPTCTFFLGIFLYHEPFDSVQLLTFCFIWSALVFYSIDSVIFHRGEG